MILAELKTMLKEGKAPSNLIVFLCEDNFFIADQYVEEICKVRNKVPRKVESLAEISDTTLGLIFDNESNLNILKTDTFSETGTAFETLTDTIILCKKIDKNLTNVLKDFVINVAAPNEWQMKAYIKTVCTGLNDNAINWLYEAAKHNIYKINNELDKLLLFMPNERLLALSELRFEPGTDLYDFDLERDKYNIKDAILRGDLLKLSDFIANFNTLNIEPTYLVSLLLTDCKQAIILLYGGGTAETFGFKQSRVEAIKKASNHLSQDKLHKLVKFLAGIDAKLKLGQLELSKESLFNYILSNVLKVVNE